MEQEREERESKKKEKGKKKGTRILKHFEEENFRNFQVTSIEKT